MCHIAICHQVKTIIEINVEIISYNQIFTYTIEPWFNYLLYATDFFYIS